MTKVTDELPGKNQPIDEEQLKATLLAQHKQTEVKKSDFPTEVIDLPSKGLLYPEGHPLASGQIEMKYMTAKEEDILASPNLLKQGKAIDKLLESLIVTPIDYNDLISGDKNAIMYAARILGYGKDYGVTYNCVECNEKNKMNIDLTTFDDKEVDFDLYSPNNSFEFKLPHSGRTLTFKLLTHGDENVLSQELKAMLQITKRTGIDREGSTRLKHLITSVDGNPDKQEIRNFVDNELLAIDSKSLKQYIVKVSPDVDTSVIYSCSTCGHDEADEMLLDVNFFWPGS